MSLDEVDLPGSFHRIRLELAREPGRPNGDAETGYMLVAPIDARGHLDPDAAREHPSACKVIRFRRGAGAVAGRLRRRPGGSWAIHYELESGEDDDPGYRLGEHVFAPGEYVTIMEDEGEHTYRVVSVQPL